MDPYPVGMDPYLWCDIWHTIPYHTIPYILSYNTPKGMDPYQVGMDPYPVGMDSYLRFI